MTVARFAVSFDESLASDIRRAAGEEPLSTWLADAARRKLRAEGLKRVVKDWEAQHGELTAEELRKVRRKQRRTRRR